VEELKYLVEAMKGYFVEVGYGQRLGIQGRGVVIELPNLQVVQEFFLFELGVVDVILGYS